MNRNSKTREILICVLVAIGILLTTVNNTKADFVFSEPENMGPPVNSSFQEASACTSADGLSLGFWRGATWNDAGGWWITVRASKDSPWESPVDFGLSADSFLNLIPMNNVLSFSTADGLEMYFSNVDAPQPSEYGGVDLCVWKRETVDDDWGTAVNLGPTVNSAWDDAFPSVSRDGLELYFRSDRPNGTGGWDIWVTTRERRNAPWTQPVNLGPLVNSTAKDNGPCLSTDSLVLFFHSDRAGGYGSSDLYMTRRASRSDPWEAAVNLGPTVNSPSSEVIPHISADGTILYFDSSRPGGLGGGDIWQTSVIPTIDFNNDGNIDNDDLLIMMANWDTDDSLCDIGPMPWGDGVVDIKDLEVFIEYWEQENMTDISEDIE